LDFREIRVGDDHLLRLVHLQLVGAKLSQTNPKEKAAKERQQGTLKTATEKVAVRLQEWLAHLPHSSFFQFE